MKFRIYGAIPDQGPAQITRCPDLKSSKKPEIPYRTSEPVTGGPAAHRPYVDEHRQASRFGHAPKLM